MDDTNTKKKAEFAKVVVLLSIPLTSILNKGKATRSTSQQKYAAYLNKSTKATNQNIRIILELEIKRKQQ